MDRNLVVIRESVRATIKGTKPFRQGDWGPHQEDILQETLCPPKFLIADDATEKGRECQLSRGGGRGALWVFQKDSLSSWHYLPSIPLYVCQLIIGEIANWSTSSMIAFMLGEVRRG